MAINFYKNHDQIVTAYKEVLDPKCNTNWAIFGYEKQTNDLTLVAKGNGGLEELQNEFSQSKILYAFCEAKDESTNLKRYLLINWQGECAPLQRKGVCMNHFADVRSFFKDSNIVLNARHEEDVEPNVLMQHVTKLVSRIKIEKPSPPTSNGNVTNHNGNDYDEPSKPVGTNYQRTVAQREISRKERELFWQKQKQEEEERLKEEKVKREMSKNEIIKQNSHKDREPDSPPKTNQSSLLRKERLEEAKSLISKNNISSARAFFEQNSASSQMSSNKPSAAAINTNHKPASVISNNISQQINALKQASTGNHAQKHINNHVEEKLEEQIATTVVNHEPLPHPEEIDEMVEKDIESSNQNNEDDEDSGEEFIPNSNYTQFTTYYGEPRQLENIIEEDHNEEDETDKGRESDQQHQQQPEEHQQITDYGLRARALYDYQAADDTEISFDPDDVITHIEQIDAGWWQGLAPNGAYGLFPANYVELINE